MRLLICTQTIDSNDPVLGFFCRWIEEFAKHAEHIEIICLKLGRSDLPKNVRVHSLGKEVGVLRMKYILNFYRYIWRLRHDYDAVFVHMNPEYVVLGGLFWRVWHKRIALWYTHKSVDMKLRVATFFANIIFTASKESFRLATKKVRVVGHGIDTDFFSPDPNVSREVVLLSVGRLMPSKRHDLAIRIAIKENKELHIVGEGSERQILEALASKLGARVLFLGALTQLQLRGEYRRADRLLHMSETGSLDKVVLEALACGLQFQTNDPALKLFENAGPEYIQKHHSLRCLIPALVSAIQNI